jgi:hypothetical protein
VLITSQAERMTATPIIVLNLRMKDLLRSTRPRF